MNENNLITRLRKVEGRIAELYNKLKGTIGGAGSNELTANQLAAIQIANSPSALNAFVTNSQLASIPNGNKDIKILFDIDGDYTFEAGDQNKIIIVAVTGLTPVSLTYTIPEGVFSLGNQLVVKLVGTANVTIDYVVQRASGGVKQYSADESLAIITFFEDTPLQNYWAFNYISSRPNAVTLNDFVNDAAAQAGGIPVGGHYHTAGTLKIRLT